ERNLFHGELLDGGEGERVAAGLPPHLARLRDPYRAGNTPARRHDAIDVPTHERRRLHPGAKRRRVADPHSVSTMRSALSTPSRERYSASSISPRANRF